MPWPLTRPNESGISIFIDCAKTASTKISIVETTLASMSSAFCGSPAARLCISAGIAPVAIAGFVGDGSGDNALIKIDCDTPAAMKRLMPDPNPHLLTTSSMNMTSTPPMKSWKTRSNCICRYAAVPSNSGAGASPPMKT